MANFYAKAAAAQTLAGSMRASDQI